MSEILIPSLFLLLALILLVAEDLLPTAGALGILAAACLIFVLYLGFSRSTAAGVGYLVLELVLVPSAFAAWSFAIAKAGVARSAYLRPPEPHEVHDSADRPDLGRLVGQFGTAATPLRPSGTVEFNGERLEGVAEQGLIPPGSPVLAVQVRSGRLVVRAMSIEPPAMG